MNEQEFTRKYLIYKVIAGSHSYGTNIESSDRDIRGIFIAPPEYGLGCLKNVEHIKIPGEDSEFFELAKFVKLALDCNPNIIELLFTEPSNILYIHPAFEKIRKNRHLFLSRKAKYTFSGYAMAQMKRIKGHNKWIQNPQPQKAPSLLDFAKIVFPDGRVVETPSLVESKLSGNFLVKVNATVYRIYFCPGFSKSPLSKDGTNIQCINVSEAKLRQRLNSVSGSTFIGILIVQEDAFRTQHRIWKEYWKWKKNRNPQRAELEEKYLFDVKHAMHLIRLLRMGKEILSEGKVIVRRPDADELLAIREGKFNYDDLLVESKKLEEELEKLYSVSDLPFGPDKEAVNQLYIDIVTEYWRQMNLTF